ncbi:MAG: hypothetical protein N2Z73_03725 [Endomicrobia bacterium]|nr:hypothetical protein [Endomicrobiia bacterium]
MTFKESEFPYLLEILANYAKKGLPVEEILKSAYDLYKKVPIYIGIVNMCLENIIKDINQTEIKNGDELIIIDKKNIYHGKVSKVENNKLILKNAKLITRNQKNQILLKLDNKKIFKFNRNVLKTLWPTLYFNNVKKRRK